MQKVIHINKLKNAQNRTSMFLKLRGTIFSWKQVFGLSPVNFTKNRNFSKSMFAGILGMIFCSVFTAAIFGFEAAFALDSSANFSVIVPEVNTLEITLSDSSLVLNLTPQMAEASFGSKDLTITVGTSNIAGYNLMMNTSNTALTSAAEDTIESLEEDEDGYVCSSETCNFTLNRWGFKKSTDDAYNYIPSSVSIASNDAPTNGEDTTINFASRVDARQPAGTYSTTLTFVATVNPTSISDISQIQYLQDFATLTADEYENVISSMETNTAYEKSDSRDKKTYNIAKLADGNIWFLDNLRLDPTAQTLTSANTNITTTPSITFTNKTSGWSGDSAYTEAWYNLDSETTEVSYGSGSNYVGGYYNYCAASAGSYCMNSSSGSGNASQDLCPAGWRMPTGGIGGEYATLAQVVTGATGQFSGTDRDIFMESAHIALSGYFWNASASDQGRDGRFWSSTFGSISFMRSIMLSGSVVTVQPISSNNRSNGLSVRCIVKAGTEMQSLSSATVARKLANVNDVASLIDTRDYQPYSVAKLADNKIWMTKNLNLPGGTEIESTKSDIPADYVLPTANGFQSGNKLPASATAGFNDDTKAFVYNSGSTTCSSSSPCYSYYSWTAVTAGSGLSITTDNTDAEYSICPKGWKLPNTRTGLDSSSDSRALLISYGGNINNTTYNSSTDPTGTTMYSRISASPAPNFLLTGYYRDKLFYDGGKYGNYWSSTLTNGTVAKSSLAFNNNSSTTDVSTSGNNLRRHGFPVRCLLAN